MEKYCLRRIDKTAKSGTTRSESIVGTPTAMPEVGKGFTIVADTAFNPDDPGNRWWFTSKVVSVTPTGEDACIFKTESGSLYELGPA